MSGPSLPTIKRLFAVSGNVCGFPNCTTTLVDSGSGKVTGRICHIKAHHTRGPRYDPSQSDEERHGFDNLILMCPVHHDVVDADHGTYTVDVLQRMKVEHETRQPTISSLSDESAKGFLINYYTSNYGQIAQIIVNINHPIINKSSNSNSQQKIRLLKDIELWIIAVSDIVDEIEALRELSPKDPQDSLLIVSKEKVRLMSERLLKVDKQGQLTLSRVSDLFDLKKDGAQFPDLNPIQQELILKIGMIWLFLTKIREILATGNTLPGIEHFNKPLLESRQAIDRIRLDFG